MKDEAMLALAKEFAKNLKTEADLNNFSKALKKLTVETALNAELTEHLGYEKNSPRIGKNTRNGYTVNGSGLCCTNLSVKAFSAI